MGGPILGWVRHRSLLEFDLIYAVSRRAIRRYSRRLSVSGGHPVGEMHPASVDVSFAASAVQRSRLFPTGAELLSECLVLEGTERVDRGRRDTAMPAGPRDPPRPRRPNSGRAVARPRRTSRPASSRLRLFGISPCVRHSGASRRCWPGAPYVGSARDSGCHLQHFQGRASVLPHPDNEWVSHRLRSRERAERAACDG